MAEDKSFLVPVPDPTLLTTAALTLSISNLKELLNNRIDNVQNLLNEKISNNYCLDEKRHRETREWLVELRAHRLESKQDREKAIDLAFQSVKELFDQQRKCNEKSAIKTEQTLRSQIQGMDNTFRQAREALSDRIASLKERIDRGTGKEEKGQEARQSQSWVIPLIIIGAISSFSLILQLVRLVIHQ